MMETLREKIEHAITSNCFCRGGEQVEGTDFAAEMILALSELAEALNARKIMLARDMETRREKVRELISLWAINGSEFVSEGELVDDILALSEIIEPLLAQQRLALPDNQ